jgi:hypothetical protein
MSESDIIEKWCGKLIAIRSSEHTDDITKGVLYEYDNRSYQGGKWYYHVKCNNGSYYWCNEIWFNTVGEYRYKCLSELLDGG